MRFILKDGRVVQGDAVVDITPKVTQTVVSLSVDERQKLGITEVVEDPRPDDAYGYVSEDPKNIGKWLFTPFAPEQLKARLIQKAADIRYNKEVGGTTYGNTYIATDRDSQKQLAVVQVFAMVNPNETYQWKVVNEKGEPSFQTFDKDLLTAVGVIVGKHVQDCFQKESDVVAGINNGDITTYEQIKAYFE